VVRASNENQSTIQARGYVDRGVLEDITKPVHGRLDLSNTLLSDLRSHISGPAMRVSTFVQRVDWLLSHQEQWVEWYREITNKHTTPLDRFLSVHFNHRRRNLFLMMKADGLFAKTTYWKDVKLSGELAIAYKEAKCKSA